MKFSKNTISNSLKFSTFCVLFSLALTSCQDEAVGPKDKNGNNNVVMPADKPTSDGKPPHEPDYGG